MLRFEKIRGDGHSDAYVRSQLIVSKPTGGKICVFVYTSSIYVLSLNKLTILASVFTYIKSVFEVVFHFVSPFFETHLRNTLVGIDAFLT